MLKRSAHQHLHVDRSLICLFLPPVCYIGIKLESGGESSLLLVEGALCRKQHWSYTHNWGHGGREKIIQTGRKNEVADVKHPFFSSYGTVQGSDPLGSPAVMLFVGQWKTVFKGLSSSCF